MTVRPEKAVNRDAAEVRVQGIASKELKVPRESSLF
jgi:hypothetical protein